MNIYITYIIYENMYIYYNIYIKNYINLGLSNKIRNKSFDKIYYSSIIYSIVFICIYI